ncbi:hypothetical protein IMZ48_47215 [Candidatus Bathyarchaeota archaeon]|nr:hypothetical protein [Candidatus Bathyarchaeota archaeon]
MPPQLRPRKRDLAPPKSRKRAALAGQLQDQQPKKRACKSGVAASSLSSPAPPKQCLAARSVFGITELIEKIFLECDQATLLTSVCRVSKQWHSIIQTSTPIQQALFFLPIQDNPRSSAGPMSNPILAKHFSSFFSTSRASQCPHVHGFPDLDFYPMFDVQFPVLRPEPVDLDDQDTTSTPMQSARRSLRNGKFRDDNEESDAQGDNIPTTATAGSSEPPSSSSSRHKGPRPKERRSAPRWPPKDTAKLERYLRDGASWRRMLVRQPPVKRLAYAERALVEVNYAVHPHYDYYKGLLESRTTLKPADSGPLPMSITTPFTVATGGLRMDTLYDTVHLNLSRTTIKDAADNPEATFLESRFHVYWDGVPKSIDCPDDRMRSQIRRAVGKAGKETVVVQILAMERPLNHRISTTPEIVKTFGTRFRSQEATGDPHFVHKKGTHAITGPNWLKKKWVSDRIDDAGFMLHWADLTDEFDEFDEFDDFDAFLFQDFLDHHMMGMYDYMDHDFGWDAWDEHYHDFE